MNILVSVVIPTHKRELKYIKRSVESVINQTYTNWEIVIVDDNSNEPEYRTMVENYVASLNSDKIHLFKNEKNLGGSLTRNRGIEESKGEYISFLDDDDAYLPYRVEEMLNFMVKNNSDMAFTNLLMRNNSEKVVDFRDHSGIEATDNEYLLRYQLTKNISGTSSFMFRKSALEKIGGFKDAKMGQDFHLVMRSIQGDLKIDYLNSNSVIIYKHSDGGISQGKNKLIGERNLYEYKKTFFNILSKDERKFVNFRHYAVMVVAYLRNRNPFGMIAMGFMAFVSSPKYFFKEVFGFFGRINSKRKSADEVPTQNMELPETVTK